MANPDYFGRNQQVVSQNTTVNGSFYNVQVVSDTVNITLKAPDGTTLLNGIDVNAGETFSHREGYSAVTKNSGSGVILLDSTN